MGFHPTQEKALIFAGDKMGNLGLFDASQSVPEVKVEDDDDNPEPEITAFKLHSRTISAFHVPAMAPNSLYSSSYDSSIRRLDLGSSVAVEVYAPTDSSVDEAISGIEISSTSPHILYFSTLNGTFGRHDTRVKAGSSATEIYQLTDKKIGGFSLHPLAPHLVATASLDRTLKIWDLRKMSGSGDSRLPALLGEHESRLSVSHASWSAAGYIATTSYDDTIKIHAFTWATSVKMAHDLKDEGMAPKKIIHHNNQTGRWVTILKAQWHARPDDGVQKLVVGNMNRFVDVYADTGEQLAQLGGDGITAVPAVAQFHPTKNWIVGGTASGKVCLWT